MRISVVNQRKITKVNFLDDEEKENQKLVEETEDPKTKAELRRSLGYKLPDNIE
jgi:hypothetical protein